MRNFPGKSPSLLSDDHLRAIGAVIVNWNSIELVMQILALGIYQIPLEKGLVFTSNLAFQNKLTILRIATHGAIKDKPAERDFLDLLDRIEKAHLKRNTVAHGLWAAGNAQGLAKRMALRVRGRKLTPAREQVPLSDLEGMATEFLKLHGELVAWARRFGTESALPNSE